MADLLVLPNQQRACRMVQASAEKLEHTGLLKRNEWLQCHKVSNWQVRENRLCQKDKEQSYQSKSLDCEVRESQGERDPHLGQKEKGQSGSMERKEWNYSEGR